MRNRIILHVISLIMFCGGVSAQNESKIAYGILLDNTGSMRSQLETVINIGKEVAKETSEKDSITIFSFESAGKAEAKAKISTFEEQNKRKLNEFLDNLYVVEGKTPLHNTIRLMSDTLKSKDKAQKVLILITDGDERINDIKQQEVIKSLKENNIKVFIIGLTSQLSLSTRASMQTKAESFLTNLANETGGSVVFPKDSKKTELIVRNLLAKNK